MQIKAYVTLTGHGSYLPFLNQIFHQILTLSVTGDRARIETYTKYIQRLLHSNLAETTGNLYLNKPACHKGQGNTNPLFL